MNEQTASVLEPCLSCGEETAVGSVFFSDRLTIPRRGGADVFLCPMCEMRIRSSHRPRQLTEEEVEAFTRAASAAAIHWWGHW
jgi:hypothetical protein